MTLERAKRRGYRLLSRGSKYFKTDLFYLTKGSFWLGLSRGFFILTGLALSVAFANLLPPEVYGNYRFVLSLFGIIGAFTLTGMNTAVVRATARGATNALRLGFRAHLRWSILMALAAFAGALYYYTNDNTTLATSLLIVGAFAPFLESARLYHSYLLGKKDFRRSTLLGFARRSIPTVAMLTALFLTDSVVLLILTYFASQTVTMLSLYWKVQREIENDSKDNTLESLTYSKHLSAMNVLSNVAAHLDKILIFHFLGAAPLAIYAFAVLVPSHLRDGNQILKTLLLPRLTNHSIASIKKMAWRKIAVLGAIMATVVFVYIITAPYIYQFLFPQYTESVLFSQVFSLSLLAAPFLVLGQTFLAHAKVKELYILKGGIPALRIVLLIILTPLYGIWGVIGALLAMKTLTILTILFLFYRLRD